MPRKSSLTPVLSHRKGCGISLLPCCVILSSPLGAEATSVVGRGPRQARGRVTGWPTVPGGSMCTQRRYLQSDCKHHHREHQGPERPVSKHLRRESPVASLIQTASSILNTSTRAPHPPIACSSNPRRRDLLVSPRWGVGRTQASGPRLQQHLWAPSSS